MYDDFMIDSPSMWQCYIKASRGEVCHSMINIMQCIKTRKRHFHAVKCAANCSTISGTLYMQVIDTFRVYNAVQTDFHLNIK